MNTISISVLDDHPWIAEGIRKVVENTHDIVFCGSAINLEQLNSILASTNINVAIFDVRLNGENIENVCRAVKKRFPDIKILIFSSFFDQMILRKTFAAGASGYALKNIALDMLPTAIRQVNNGGVFISPEIVTDAILPSVDQGKSSLSKREELMIEMIGDGKSNKEIAMVLGISPHTVKMYVSRLLKKYHYRNRSQLPGLSRK